MKRTLLYISIFAILTACISGCGKKSEPAKETETSEQNEEAKMNDVSLTDAQVKSLKVTKGKIPHYQFLGQIEANGTLAVMPQSEASVSPFMGANVKAILVKEGQYVHRGQPLAYLSHPDLLDLQSRYLLAYNRLTYVSKEYYRQKKLYTEKIGAGKDFQQIQSEYNSLQAELRTTGAQLRLIGINPAKVSAGKVVTSIVVPSPISGTVEQIKVKTGQYVDSQTSMFRVVNLDNIYADLLVFEKDAPLVRVGQRVTLLLKSATGAEYTGKVYSVGKTFDSNPKAIHVRVTINGSKRGLITGMYLCGKIASDTESLTAISEEGVVDDAGKSYVFTVKQQKGKWIFHPVEIETGRKEAGYVEIKSSVKLDVNQTYALNNAYYLLSEMKKSETGEE